tara:strand:- start:85 stop:540 length:456 start_codon:yes stop_codon:yes gene_type:complete
MMNKIDKLRANLRELSPHSGCLTEKEAKFCNIAHFGEWNPAQKEEIFSNMNKKNLEKFLKAKKEFRDLEKAKNKYDTKWISNLKKTLFNLAPHSGCLTEKEAKFCNMAHYGEWEPNILTSMIGKMSSNNRKKFLEAKEKFKLYIEVNENCL